MVIIIVIIYSFLHEIIINKNVKKSFQFEYQRDNILNNVKISKYVNIVNSNKHNLKKKQCYYATFKHI